MDLPSFYKCSSCHEEFKFTIRSACYYVGTATLDKSKRDFYRTLTLPVAAAKRLLNGGEVERQQISNVRASRPLGQFA